MTTERIEVKPTLAESPPIMSVAETSLHSNRKNGQSTKVVAFLPAKGSSERVPNKNLQLLDGKPLFLYTLEKLLASGCFDEVYLDSESSEILRLASYLPCQKLLRDPALATNATDGHALFMQEIDKVQADIYVQVLCTSPFIRPETIRRGIDILIDDPTYDSVVLVRREKLYQWKDGQPAYGRERIPNSTDLEDTIVETMGLYMMRADAAQSTRRRFGDRPYLLKASPIESIDVNTPEDLDLAHHVAAGIREAERKKLRCIEPHLSSPMLSDILDDLGVKGVIPGLKSSLPDVRVLGRAKTLHLRPLAENEDWQGIYEALESYESIVPNDVIVVQNDAGEFAYFGELNSLLASRAGASAAVIDGKTRDSDITARLGFPVFTEGTVCRDVRGRATVESINQPVELQGIAVLPGDLVFCDNEGVVIIPRHVENEVLNRAMKTLRKEWGIKMDIALSENVPGILLTHGEF